MGLLRLCCCFALSLSSTLNGLYYLCFFPPHPFLSHVYSDSPLVSRSHCANPIARSSVPAIAFTSLPFSCLGGRVIRQGVVLSGV
jgi:hypothetical protein